MFRLFSFLAGWKAKLAAAGAVLLAVLVGVLRVYLAFQRAATDRIVRRSQEDILEMHRDATDIEREVRSLSDEEARREALAWSRQQQ